MSRYFDGVDDEINIQNSIQFNIFKITVSAWVWLDPSVSVNQRGVVCKQSGSSIANGEWRLGGITANSWNFRINNGATATASSTQNYSLGAWHHLVGTYDAAFVRLFVDGIQTASAPRAGNLTNSNSRVQFGRNNDTDTEDLLGFLDNVKIYNRAISAGEVVALFRGIHIPGGLIAHWPLRGRSSLEPDYTDGRNHGVVSGALFSEYNPPTLFNVFKGPEKSNLYHSTFISSTNPTPPSTPSLRNRKFRNMMGVGL